MVGSRRNTPPPDADERTALLPDNENGHQVQQQHHLSANDPAVSPYNLLRVRTLRYASIGLLALAGLWWLLLLISTFVTPPGLHTSGGGWWSFSFATLSFALLLTLLLFYRTPSHTERVLYALTLLFTFTSLLLLVIPSGTRHAESFTGLASAAFAVFVAAWCIICDRTVEFGKHHEETRLAGARARHRTVKQYLSVFGGSIVLILILSASILFTINLSILARDKTLPAPGRLYPVENGGYSVHIFCAGNKTDDSGEKHTTVLLEGGHEPVELRLESWVREAHERNHTAVKRYCYWDRPGYAFSGNAPSPQSAGRVVDALPAALTAAGEEGPWVLVSHGVGGVYSRVFAARHAGEVKGLMLVDALHESLLYRIGGAKRGFLLWVRGVLYPLGLDRIWATWFLGRGREERVYGRNAYMQGGEIKAKLQESLVATSFTKNEIIAAAAILPRDIPLVVVSSGRKVRHDRMWSDGQRHLTRVTDELVSWDVVEGAGHEVWRDNEGRVLLQKRLVELLGR